jgi:hypothetical protein
MSTHAAARSIGLFLSLLTAAACGIAGPPAATMPGASAHTPANTPVASPSGDSPAATDAAPPAATLVGPTGAAAAGVLGTFSWDGLVSDAPWIVAASAGGVRVVDRLEVILPPDAVPAAWQARWAPVAGGQAGTAIDGGSGGGAPIRVSPPAMPGAWSLQLTARFGVGRSATWYWRVEVVP